MGVELWANHMGLKPRCYWEHLGEQIWEHFGNFLGTGGEHIGKKGEKNKKKNPLPHPLKNLRKKLDRS
jgi:hypothetical protein